MVNQYLESLSFSWETQNRYVKLVNFEIEIMNIPETRAEEENIPVIKNWLGQEGLQLKNAELQKASSHF